MSKIIDLKDSGMKATIINVPIINKEQSINIQKTYIATVKKDVTKTTEDFFTKGENEHVVDQADRTDDKLETPVVIPSNEMTNVTLPTDTSAIIDLSTTNELVNSEKKLDDLVIPALVDIQNVGLSKDLPEVNDNSLIKLPQVDNQPQMVNDTNEHDVVNEIKEVVANDNSVIELPQADTQPQMINEVSYLDDTITSMPSIPLSSNQNDDQKSEELDVSGFSVADSTIEPITSNLVNIDKKDDSLSVDSQSVDDIQPVSVEIKNDILQDAPVKDATFATNELSSLSVSPVPEIGTAPFVPETPTMNNISSDLDESVVAPVSVVAPLVLDGSKETNLNKALDEVGGTIQVESIESVREFGEDIPVDAPVVVNNPQAVQSIAPMVQPELAADPKTLVKKAGFANSKFFMVIAILFFLSSCVFLGYEAFQYFKVK